MRAQILARINEIVREEHGTRVSETSKILDTELDSFGFTMLFITLDQEYKYFEKAGYDGDVSGKIPYATLTISEMIDICAS